MAELVSEDWEGKVAPHPDYPKFGPPSINGLNGVCLV